MKDNISDIGLTVKCHVKALARARFSKVPKSFRIRKTVAKLSNLLITELFYLKILNMNRVQLHTRSFRRAHLSDLTIDYLKMALKARRVSRGFR